jgi:hypothetical protein
MSEVLIPILTTLIGGLLGFALARYQARLVAQRDLRPLGVKLAALAIRARQEVINQFVKVSEGPWIPDALARQKYLLDDLEHLMQTVQAQTDELHLLLWAARDALESNMAVLSSWQYNHDLVASVDHIGPESPSHRDVFAVAQFLTRAVEIIPDKAVRNSSRRLAERIPELRREAHEVLNPTIAQLQQNEAFRADWVRTGRER